MTRWGKSGRAERVSSLVGPPIGQIDDLALLRSVDRAMRLGDEIRNAAECQ